ncbi:MAG: NAD(P)-dependent alcohol dehydrogenase [Steroidobacteraceae bacterium]
MKAWRVPSGGQIDGLQLVEEAPSVLSPGQVRVSVRAAALNFRDLMVLRGGYPVSTPGPLVPGSDAAGLVTEIAAGVQEFQVGDRVATSFFPDWVEGRMTVPRILTPLGGGGVGTMAEEIVLPATALVRSPAHLSDTEAATLTCAGTTAWHALFETGTLQPGNTVLLLGTGGVSIWALQLAKAAGMRVIITSSSDAKLARARALGADETINYQQVPEWSAQVRQLTGGEGVDLVLEVGGEKTVQQSIAAVRPQGTVAIIGGVSGMGGAIAPRSLIFGATRVQGVYVGSRRMHADLARFVAAKQLHPVVDQSFAFTEVPAAYRHFQSGQHFGKVTISMA